MRICVVKSRLTWRPSVRITMLRRQWRRMSSATTVEMNWFRKVRPLTLLSTRFFNERRMGTIRKKCKCNITTTQSWSAVLITFNGVIHSICYRCAWAPTSNSAKCKENSRPYREDFRVWHKRSIMRLSNTDIYWTVCCKEIKENICDSSSEWFVFNAFATFYKQINL